MNRATSHARSRVLVALAIVTGHAIVAPRVSAQPGPAMPSGRLSLPPLHDGSHDFDFLEGAWRFRQGRLIRPLSGPNAPSRETTGRLVARMPDVGSATVEWETTLPDSTRVSGFARMSYDPRSRQWTIREAESGTASPELPLVGQFENGVGSFHGLREYEGRTVLARMTWRIVGLGRAQFERAFSTDGGTSWETHWIKHLSRESRAPVRRISREAVCCGKVELVWYTVPPGKDEELVHLFARESFAMGDSVPVQDVALLRDLGNPATFVLVRGFDWAEPIREFYDGLPWAAHRATLGRARIRADSVYELRAGLGTAGFTLGERLTPGPTGSAPGIVVATVYHLDQRRSDAYTFGTFFVQSVVPRTIATGARLLAVFATDDFGSGLWTGQRMVSAIPARPLPPQRSGVMSFAWFADTVSYERHRHALEADPFWRETVVPGLARFGTSMSTTSPLVPVGRSRELRDWLERPQ